MRHLERPAVLGVDPRLILVFELSGPVDPADFRRAGLRVLDGSDDHVVVAFADDPELAAFHERLDALRGGIPEGQRNEPYAGFFDSIESLRVLGPEDRISDRLRETIEDRGDEELRVDIECWHPEDVDLANAWLSDLAEAVSGADGRIVDRYIHNSAGLLLARAYLKANAIAEIAKLDIVARLDVLPRPALTLPQLFGSDLDELPASIPPASGAPIVGIVDSGVRSAHPLLAGAILAADAIGTGLSEGQDQHGHGTMVAALIAHGDVEQAVTSGLPLRSICRIVSARVLDAQNQFPDDVLWEHELQDAIEWCVAQGASIVNLSVGDSSAVLSSRRQTRAAAVVDDLARRLGVTIIVAAGNVGPMDYLSNIADSMALTYPEELLRAPQARLTDPAPAMLALTVGAITMAEAATGLSARESVIRVPMGRPGWPAPFTRLGPGLAGAVKPELVERGGTLGIESGRLVDNDAELSIISANGSSDRILGFDIGTSFAAPLVTRVAAAVKARFPQFSSNLVRSLVLLSARASEFGMELQVDRPSDRVDAVYRLVGFGRPSVERAIASTPHRVVLVTEDSIPVDGIHVYQLPVPGSFRRSGGQRGIDIALAYDPPTRIRRLDYLASGMEFHLVRGISLDEVIASFMREDPEADLEESDDPNATGVNEDDIATEVDAEPPTLSGLKSHVCRLEPSSRLRSRGANQLGRATFTQRFDPARHEPLHLVIRNVNRWADSTSQQPYALAVAMWRTESQGELYAELAAQLEAVVEVQIEVEAEIEI
jgi:hypothetical protein